MNLACSTRLDDTRSHRHTIDITLLLITFHHSLGLSAVGFGVFGVSPAFPQCITCLN